TWSRSAGTLVDRGKQLFLFLIFSHCSRATVNLRLMVILRCVSLSHHRGSYVCVRMFFSVGYILNVTREIDNFFPESFTYMNIRQSLQTTEGASLDLCRKSGQAVLVHCKMGVSRSASTVISYAMKQQRWPLDVALAYVRDRRSIIKPNEGFMKQLQTYNGILKARSGIVLVLGLIVFKISFLGFCCYL
uniref:Uncharacterized protein n=1 Tax=Scophthalmus maximus TaxID=52904 RepID=A0A8D3BMN1_SCOMX